MKYLKVLMFFFIASISSAQSIYVEGGLLFFKNKIVSPLKLQNPTNSQDEYMMVGYEHKLSGFYDISVSFDYSYYFNGPEFSVKAPDNSESYIGFGGFGTTFNEGHAFAIGARLPKTFYNRITISSGLYFKTIKVNNTWSNEFNVPFSDEPYTGIYSSSVYEGWKYQPEIRFALDIRFLRRMHFYVNFGFSYGFSKWQDLTYDYSYKGVPQPRAEVYVDGTGRFANIGLKFDFVSQVK